MGRSESTADLFDAASRAGLAVTSDQLKSLRRNGLLPHPRQVHALGTAGSAVLYPKGTGHQLVAVLQIRRDRRSKPLRAVRFIAWEQGLDVDFQMLRSDLVSMVRLAITPLRSLSKSRDWDDQLSVRVAKLKDDNYVPPLLLQPDPDSELTIEDVGLAALQLAADTNHTEVARETFDAALPPDRLTTDNTIPISEVYGSLGFPPMPEWPRVLSRTGRIHFETARQILRTFHAIVGAPVVDTDSALSQRAMTAAAFIVGSKTNPEGIRMLTST